MRYGEAFRVNDEKGQARPVYMQIPFISKLEQVY